jgi:flagellar biosynthesis chaperone FliJ
MNKMQTWKYLAEKKEAEFSELDIEYRELVNVKTSIEEKTNFVTKIIEEQEAEETLKDVVFRLDGIHKSRQVYLSQLRKMLQGLATQIMDVQVDLSRVQEQMWLLQIEKQRYEKLAEISSKKLEKLQAQLEQKESDGFALQSFLQK